MFGKTQNGQTLFVGVEVKVDETFGPTVHGYYLAAKAKQITGTSTNAPKRVEPVSGMRQSRDYSEWIRAVLEYLQFLIEEGV